MSDNNYKEKLNEKKEEIKDELRDKIQDIKNTIYSKSNIICGIIIILCFCWILYSINRTEPVNSNGVDKSIEDLRGEVQQLTEDIRKLSDKTDKLGKSNQTIYQYNQSIQTSQQQTAEELGKAGTALQSATEQAQVVDQRNREAESGLIDMQTTLNELHQQQSELDRLITEAERINQGTGSSN